MNSRPARIFIGSLWHLAFLALMLSVFAPRGGAFWQCEGRLCGISAWVCCCFQADANHDSDCGPSQSEKSAHFASASHSQETVVCAASCHCTVVAQSLKQPLSRATFFSPPCVATFAVLPAACALALPCATEAVCPVESRGPPPSAALFASPSLRAPPIA